MPSAWALLAKRDFRRVYLAVAVSELGDALHYIALMWIALEKGGALGVIAVRLADSVPAIVFGFHGGLAADRWSRKRLMIGADLVRAVVLLPVAAAGLAGRLSLWELVVAAFVLEAATSYFAPAYGAVLPQVVDRENVLAANGLLGATTNAVSIGGWAAAAGLLAIVPLSGFFALNSLSFFASALLLAGIAVPATRAAHAEPPRLREGFAALRPLPWLAAGVAMLGLGVTLSSGTWIGGVPQLVHDRLHHEAGGFSVVMVGYALGSIGAAMTLARVSVRSRARASLLAWLVEVPSAVTLAFAGTLPAAVGGALLAGAAQTASVVLLHSAAQKDVDEAVLGRVMGLISLVHRGAHATGLLLVAPLFALYAPRPLFLAASLAYPVLVMGALAFATSRHRAAPARGDG